MKYIYTYTDELLFIEQSHKKVVINDENRKKEVSSIDTATTIHNDR